MDNSTNPSSKSPPLILVYDSGHSLGQDLVSVQLEADSPSTNKSPDPSTSVQVLIIFLVAVFAILILFLFVYFYLVKGSRSELPLHIAERTIHKSISGSVTDDDRSRNIFSHPEKQMAVDQSTRNSPSPKDQALQEIVMRARSRTPPKEESLALKSGGFQVHNLFGAPITQSSPHQVGQPATIVQPIGKSPIAGQSPQGEKPKSPKLQEYKSQGAKTKSGSGNKSQPVGTKSSLGGKDTIKDHAASK